MTNNFMKSWKFYDRKGRRVSIFGWFNAHKDVLKVYVFTTSLSDVWSKEEANRLLEQHLFRDLDEQSESNPLVINIQTDAYNSRNAFMHFCNTSYFRKEVMPITFEGCNQVMNIDILVNEKLGISYLLKDTLHYTKKNKKQIQAEFDNEVTINSISEFLENMSSFVNTDVPSSFNLGDYCKELDKEINNG